MLVLLSLSASGCKPDTAIADRPRPAEVTTTELIPHDVSLTYTYGGRVTAFRQVEVRARVAGILQQRGYSEGARVQAGDVLFRIDPAPYEVAVARAAAEVRQRQAQREKAQRDFKRASVLLTSQAGTVLARDDALSALALADAGLAAAEADLRGQILNLSYTSVTAPLSGVTSLEAVPEGGLVGNAPGNSLLTRITQTDPIYVSFSFDSDDVTEIRALSGDNAANLHLWARVVANGKQRDGFVNFTDSSIDQATGTVRGRALFTNADGVLTPGQFVQITLGGVTLRDALTVPKAAIDQDATGSFVYLADHGRARRVEVRLEHDTGRDWVVSGVLAGNAVVTEGLVHVREGGPLRVVQN
jgi:membrane fusion protein (multidrug efflux system)